MECDLALECDLARARVPSSWLLLATDKREWPQLFVPCRSWGGKGSGDNVGNCVEDQEAGQGLGAARETQQA